MTARRDAGLDWSCHRAPSGPPSDDRKEEVTRVGRIHCLEESA